MTTHLRVSDVNIDSFLSDWAYFEGFVRDLTKNFTDVYVFTGPLFLPQPMKDSTASSILKQPQTGSNPGYYVYYPVLGTIPNVAVPTHFFKVILATNSSGSGEYAMGAFVLPNKAIDSKTPLTNFQVQLSSIEKASGLVFFEKLDRSTFLDLCKQTTCAV